MIELSIEEFLLSSLSISILSIGLFSLVGYFRVKEGDGFLSRLVMRCVVCDSVFHDDSNEQHPRCANCSRENCRGGSSRLG